MTIVADHDDGACIERQLLAKGEHHAGPRLDAVAAVETGEKIELVQHVEGLQGIGNAVVAVRGRNPEFPARLLELIQRSREALDRAILFDQLNVSNCAFAETLIRRMQTIEVAVNANPEAPDYSAASFLQSDIGVRDGALLDPRLLSPAMKRLQEDKKVHDHNTARRPKRKPKGEKGDGKGQQ